MHNNPKSTSPLHLMLLGCFCLWLWACGTEGTEKSKLPIDQVQTNQQGAGLNGVKEQITKKLTAYYTALNEGTISASDYYAPNVERFFNSKNISVDNIDQSLQNSITQNKNRHLQLDAGSVEVRSEGGEYMVSLAGTASFTDESGLVTREDPFQNKLRLNKDLLIVSYESLSDPGATRKVAQANTTMEILVERLLPALQEGNFASVRDCVHPEYGYYLITKPGVIPEPTHLDQLEQLPDHSRVFKGGWADISRQAVAGSLPNFDCDNQFSKTGAYWSGIIDAYQGISELMELSNENKRMYSEARMSDTRGLEDLVTYQLVDTQSGAALYFGEVKGKWYLLVIDLSLYDCSA